MFVSLRVTSPQKPAKMGRSKTDFCFSIGVLFMTIWMERILGIVLFLFTYIALVGIAHAKGLNTASDLALICAPLFMIWLDRAAKIGDKRERPLLNVRSSWAKGAAFAAITVIPFNLSATI